VNDEQNHTPHRVTLRNSNVTAADATVFVNWVTRRGPVEAVWHWIFSAEADDLVPMARSTSQSP